MIQTLFNSLFNIRCNGVQNLKIVIGHVESQNTCASTTLRILENASFILHAYMVARFGPPGYRESSHVVG